MICPKINKTCFLKPMVSFIQPGGKEKGAGTEHGVRDKDACIQKTGHVILRTQLKSRMDGRQKSQFSRHSLNLDSHSSFKKRKVLSYHSTGFG